MLAIWEMPGEVSALKGMTLEPGLGTQEQGLWFYKPYPALTGCEGFPFLRLYARQALPSLRFYLFSMKPIEPMLEPQ